MRLPTFSVMPWKRIVLPPSTKLYRKKVKLYLWGAFAVSSPAVLSALLWHGPKKELKPSELSFCSWHWDGDKKLPQRSSLIHQLCGCKQTSAEAPVKQLFGTPSLWGELKHLYTPQWILCFHFLGYLCDSFCHVWLKRGLEFWDNRSGSQWDPCSIPILNC